MEFSENKRKSRERNCLFNANYDGEGLPLPQMKLFNPIMCGEVFKIEFHSNPGPAEPGYALPLQTV